MHVCLCSMCMKCPQRPEEGARFPETVVTDGCGRPCGWEPSLGPLQEQVLLTTEPLTNNPPSPIHTFRDKNNGLYVDAVVHTLAPFYNMKGLFVGVSVLPSSHSR